MGVHHSPVDAGCLIRWCSWGFSEHAGRARKRREGGGFALRLFAGLMVFNLFAEVVGRASSMVLEQPNLVKKVTFPLELLSFVAIGSALFHFFLSSCILLLGNLLVRQSLPPTVLLLPVVTLPLLPLLLGLSWALAAAKESSCATQLRG